MAKNNLSTNPTCPDCGHTTVKNGTRAGKQRYRCKKCGWFSKSDRKRGRPKSIKLSCVECGAMPTYAHDLCEACYRRQLRRKGS